MSACDFTWCKDTRTTHQEHTGIIGTAVAGESEVDVHIYLDEGPKGDTALTYSFDMDWEIQTGDAAREISDMRSIVDQVEDIVAAAEEVYPVKWRELATEVTR